MEDEKGTRLRFVYGHLTGKPRPVIWRNRKPYTLPEKTMHELLVEYEHNNHYEDMYGRRVVTHGLDSIVSLRLSTLMRREQEYLADVYYTRRQWRRECVTWLQVAKQLGICKDVAHLVAGLLKRMADYEARIRYVSYVPVPDSCTMEVVRVETWYTFPSGVRIKYGLFKDE